MLMRAASISKSLAILFSRIHDLGTKVAATTALPHLFWPPICLQAPASVPARCLPLTRWFFHAWWVFGCDWVIREGKGFLDSAQPPRKSPSHDSDCRPASATVAFKLRLTF